MNEVAVLVILALLALGMLFGLILLWRRPAGTIGELDDRDQSPLLEADVSAEFPPEAIEHIFGSGDLRYIRSKTPDRVRRAFERDRRQIALHWVRSASAETQRVMSRHFKAVRSSPDLSLSLEAKLVAEFLLHQSGCLMLAGVIRLAGPDGLTGVAGAISNLRHQVGIVIDRASSPADGDFRKGSDLRIHS